LYDRVRFLPLDHICFIQDRTYLIVYDQIRFVLAVLVRLIPSDSCKIFADILQLESDEILKKTNTYDIAGSCEKILQKILYV
jgi:hypothetical protein